ncbi:uncharacterized protein CIMG_03642 [Coccidioides immitis RS]|uniref:Rhodopsin domain-containing protein n=1 Tax=Coccidioides immitis (strain RS) TaxID=246410 RepID=J3KBU0_COCIM|nr:uncharacterized protein CIMG_03642 [Coccidioides immitis RS]EAS32618.3 hypothetical protein CIMG_03642 [Coccidioides immitis RS]
MRKPPPQVFDSWPEPNYVDPEHKGPELIIVSLIFTSISFVIVGLRMFVRLRIKKPAGWDDWLMLATLPFIAGGTASSILGTYHGWGYHMWDNKPEWTEPAGMSSWFSQLNSIIIMTLVKLSILVSYLRISVATKFFRRATWVMITMIVLWGLALTLSLFFVCVPLRFYWHNRPDKHCVKDSARVISGSITNVITDILVFVLPIPTLCKLRLPTRERVILAILMNLGLIYERNPSSPANILLYIIILSYGRTNIDIFL